MVVAVTLLIATRDGVWGDRRVSGGSTRFRPATKVGRGPGVVAGFCGSASACTKALRAVRSGEIDPHALAERCDGLLVTDDGVIWELWDKLAERTPKREAYAVHGSGHGEAQAFLSGAAGCDPAAIRRAFRYVSRVRTDCGDGYDFRGFTK